MLTAMKRIVSAIAIAMVAGAASLPAQAQTKLTAGMSWVNELGSVLTINSVGANGLLTGTYVTAAGCSAGKPQPMTGWFYAGASGSSITFSVYWSGCNSLTSWSGQYNNSDGHFAALWYLTLASATAWNGTNAGSDTFVPK
jgi:hypothetical protein